MKIIFDLTGCTTFTDLEEILNEYDSRLIDFESKGIINNKTSEKLRCQLRIEVQNTVDELVIGNDKQI